MTATKKVKARELEAEGRALEKDAKQRFAKAKKLRREIEEGRETKGHEKRETKKQERKEHGRK